MYTYAFSHETYLVQLIQHPAGVSQNITVSVIQTWAIVIVYIEHTQVYCNQYFKIHFDYCFKLIIEKH